MLAGNGMGHSPSLFENGLDAVAGVVDDDVYPAEGGERLLHALLDHVRGVGDIEFHEPQRTVGGGEGSPQLFDVASGSDDEVSSCEDRGYETLAEA